MGRRRQRDSECNALPGTAALVPEKRAEVEEEMADVMLNLVRLTDKLDVYLVEAAQRKLQANAVKYPVEKARGRREKYTEL